MVLIQREPVLNRHKTITASRLRVHAASAEAAAAELARLAEDWPDARDIFISFADPAMSDALHYWQPPRNVMLEIRADRLDDPATVTLIADLVGRQIPLCLDNYDSSLPLPLKPSFRFLLSDANAQPDMHEAPASPLAKGLADSPAFTEAIAHGYAGAVGWFFLQTPREPSAKLNPNHARIIDLLNLVRNNAEVAEIELALKKDVTLAFKLLRYINSAGFGLMCEIQSFRHAVSILGYDALNKWLSLLLVTASRDPSAPALMQTAIARGRFMEEIGSSFFEAGERDNLFITGAFSLLHTLLGTSMQTLLEEMNLPANVSEALLYGQGEFAPFLRLAQSCEQFDVKALTAAASELHLPFEQVNRAQLVGLGFADSLHA